MNLLHFYCQTAFAAKYDHFAGDISACRLRMQFDAVTSSQKQQHHECTGKACHQM
jgi:hypothetical protein